MASDDTFRPIGEPQLGFGRLLRELLHLLGISSFTLAAILRAIFRSWFGLRWVSSAAIILRSEVGRSRSFIRAVGNTFPFPVGNVFIHLEELAKEETACRQSVGSAGSELWENADSFESENAGSGSGNAASESSGITCASLEAERIAKLEAELERLKELVEGYKNGLVEKSRAVASSPVAEQAKGRTPLSDCPAENNIEEQLPNGDDKSKQSIPVAPPLPSFLLPSRARVPTFTAGKKKDEQQTNAVLPKSEPCINFSDKPQMSDLLKELPTVRLRPVEKALWFPCVNMTIDIVSSHALVNAIALMRRSPGGTPLIRRNPQRPETANLLELMLRMKFANARAETEDEEDGSNHQAGADTRWCTP